MINNYLFIVNLLLIFCIFNSGITKLNFFDEIFLFFSVLIIIFKMTEKIISRRVDKIYLILLLYILYQVINYLVSPFSLKLELVIAQSFINMKVFFVAFSILLIWNETKTTKRHIKYIYYLFIGLFIFGMFANFVLQENWHYLTGHGDTISYRYDFIRPVGWLGNAAQNSYFFAITFVTLLLLYTKKPIIKAGVFVNKFFVFTVIDFLMAFPLSVRKGMMMIIPFGFTAFNLLKGYRKIIFFGVGFLFIGLFILLIKDLQIFQDTTQNFQDMTTAEDNSYIRGLMIYYGFSLFLEFFPFGVGNATFGTVLSQFNTLDVYSYVGLDLHRIYYREGQLSGVYDSGLFSMLAENGFIGMVLMSIFIYYFFKFNKKRLDDYNYLIFKIITWFSLLLSITEPVWQNGMFTVIYAVNLLFIYSKNNLYRINKKWVKLYSKDFN